ncbi:MAG TPA: HPr family phosphocarrier protein [Synergistales bacterium]|jgi:phosphocarrier protein|nr:HPr family phosphocarrier protein [Synergistaceae bacterium]HPE67041.1 HPr family phosphocarrier protein [Synergistales bacterium]
MEKQVVVRNPHGLHARPAAKFVQAASSVPEDVIIEKNGKTANAKSILSIMSLGVSKGDTVTLRVAGESGEALLQTLEGILVSEAE